MSGAVQLVAGGEVRVGDATYPGGALPDGRVALLGVALRRLRLAERDRLVSLVTGLVPGSDEARTLAGLVLGAAATPGEPLPRDDEERAAAEAVALHLAGAALDGPLARTRLLVARSAGAAADELAAADADVLAAELARAVVADDGWTRLVLDAADASGGRPGAVRDRLASALLARATEPLEPALARALLTGPLEDVTDPGDDPRWADARASGAPDSRWPTSASLDLVGDGGAPWSADDAHTSADEHAVTTGPVVTTGHEGTPDLDLLTGGAGTGTTTDPAARRELADRPDGAGLAGSPAVPPVLTPAAGPVPAARRDAVAPGTSGGRPLTAGPRLSPQSPLGTLPERSPQVDRWGAPVGAAAHGPLATTTPERAGGTPVGGAWATEAGATTPASAGALAATAVPSTPGATLMRPWPAAALPTFHDAWDSAASTRTDGPGTAPSTDELALALHRAADLRGLRR